MKFKPRAVPKEIEAQVIECAVNAYAEYAYALDQLSPDEMFRPEYANILQLAQDLYRNGKEVNLLSIYDASGQSDDIMATIINVSHSCASYVPTESLVKIKEAARYRRISLQMLQTIENRPDDLLLELEKIIETERNTSVKKRVAQDKYHEYIESLRNPLNETRIETGFTKLDGLIGRLPIGSVSCVGARTGSGKTAFALNVAIRQIKAGRKICYASLEMSESQLYDRITSMISGIPYEMIRDHVLTEKQYEEAAETERLLADYPGELIIADNLYSIDAILAWASYERPELLIIDFLQYVKGTGKSDYDVMNNVVRRIKQAARIYNTHIMLVSQLNRDAEGEKGEDESKKPRLRHLKGCGGIEEGSDIVILLYRTKGTDAPEIEYIVAKNKFGRTGFIRGDFKGAYQRMTEAI